MPVLLSTSGETYSAVPTNDVDRLQQQGRDMWAGRRSKQHTQDTQQQELTLGHDNAAGQPHEQHGGEADSIPKRCVLVAARTLTAASGSAHVQYRHTAARLRVPCQAGGQQAQHLARARTRARAPLQAEARCRRQKECLCAAKVDELQVALLVQQQVLWLQVPVDDLLGPAAAGRRTQSTLIQ